MYVSDKPVMGNFAFWFFSILLLPIALLIPLVSLFDHRYATFNRIKDWQLLGNVFFLYYVIMVIISFNGSTDGALTVFITSTILFLLPGIYCYVRSRNLKKLMNERYNTYADLLINHGLRTVSDVATRARVRMKGVYNDLIRMMHIGVFDGYYMSIHDDVITLRSHEQEDENINVNIDLDFSNDDQLAASINNLVAASMSAAFGNQTAASPPSRQPELTPKKVECGGCGSSNLLKPGQSTACEYCGAPVAYS